MDKFKHTDVKYISGEREACLLANAPEFRKMVTLDEENQYYEIELARSSIKMNIPIQIAKFVLDYAKLLIVSYYYSFLDRYLDRSDFEMVSMDTVWISRFHFK